MRGVTYNRDRINLGGNKRYSIFNTYVDALTMDETLKRIQDIVEARIPVQHVVLNAGKVNMMQDDEHLTNIINSCKLINADGASILWAAKQFGISLPERVTGIDLFIRLLELSEKKGYRIFLFGASENVVRRVKVLTEDKYPSIQITGYRNGYFSAPDNAEIVKTISESQSDILFVAFSSPKKEYWVYQNLGELNVPFVMGVGGSFDVIAGVTKRAPIWMQQIGFEWFFRFIQEPGRMWRRYLIGNIKFIRLVMKYKRRINRNSVG